MIQPNTLVVILLNHLKRHQMYARMTLILIAYIQTFIHRTALYIKQIISYSDQITSLEGVIMTLQQ